MTIRRQWDGTEWQSYSHKLAQLRHGAANVQAIPDKVRGDCGIEFFVTDGCLYQCYAPEEVSDVAKAASGMMTKARRDLNKLKKYRVEIADILQSLKARRWILVCPFLDDKKVVAYVRALGEKLKTQGLAFIAPDFEALVHSQDDFTSEIEQLRLKSIGPSLKVDTPTEAEVQTASGSVDLGAKLNEKLSRAFPNESVQKRESRAESYIKSLLHRDNTLNVLKLDHPILWERSIKCIEAEEQRLAALGGQATQPPAQLEESMNRIEASLKQDLRDLPTSIVTTMSQGTVADWLVRCPLDFA